MKTRKLPTLIVRITQSSIVLLTTAWLSGCASAGYDKSEAASQSLEAAAAEVQGESRALELTMAALKDLVDKPSGDLKLQFVRYSKALHELEASARRNEGAAQRVHLRNTAYFMAWDRELATMNYEAVRTQSEARKTEVAKHSEEISHRYHDTQTSLQPLLDYLADIRKALSADLTTDGVRAVKDLVNKAQENGSKVQAALAKLAEDLTTSSSRMSSVTVQNAAPRDGS